MKRDVWGSSVLFFILFLFDENAANAAIEPLKEAAQDPAKVITRVLKNSEAFDSLLFPAKVFSRVETHLYAESDGIVKTFPKNVGQKVSKKETILVIQNTDPVYQYAPVKVISPVEGVVSLIEVRQGTHVTKGTRLATVTDPTKLRISVEVPALDLSLVQIGKTGEFKTSASSQAVSVKVIGVSPWVDSKTGTATAELDLADASEASKSLLPGLVPGLVGQVSLKINIHETIVVPESAIVYREGKASVRILEDGKSKIIPVELGIARRGNVEIKSGIKSGQTLILRASRFVSDGEAVSLEDSNQNKEST